MMEVAGIESARAKRTAEESRPDARFGAPIAVYRRLFAFLGIAATATLAAVVFVGAVFDDPPADDRNAWVRSWVGAGLEVRAESELRDLIIQDPSNVRNHHRWITLHYSRSRGNENVEREGRDITAYYNGMLLGGDPALIDVARYARGLILSSGADDCKGAMAWFGRISDREIPYLNNSIGNCLQRLGRREEATAFFVREIELGGNVGGASRNLAENLMALGEREALTRKVESDEAFRNRLPGSFLRRLSLSNGEIIEYLGRAGHRVLERATWSGLAAAVSILLVWLVFLMRLDVFEPEAPQAILVTLGLGMAGGVLCVVPYDLASVVLGAGFTGDMVNDLLYCIFGIGLIEETVKLAPLVVVLRWTSWVDEPVDVVIYAATSALGFAFVENILYFHPMGLDSIHGRAFTATILHISLSAVAAYGLLVARRRKQSYRRGAFRIAAMFWVAVAVHGLYDFILMGEGWIESFRIAALLVIVVMAMVFQRTVANGLSGSPYWNEQSNRRVIDLWWYLCLNLSGVVLLEYLLLAASFGPTPAGLGLMSAVVVSVVLLTLLVSQLATVEVVRHRWVPLIDRRDFRRRAAKKDTR